MTVQIKSTIPVLASPDPDESLAFYTDKSGFAKVGRYDDYAMAFVCAALAFLREILQETKLSGSPESPPTSIISQRRLAHA